MARVEYYLGIDFGEARIGLALANSVARLPSAYAVLPNDTQIWATLEEIINQERINQLVVGLPRDVGGQETEQSQNTRNFAGELARRSQQPLVMADESLSSVRAASSSRYKPTNAKHQDDIAACYILEEFLG